METLRSISSSRLVLQWIPAHCGIQGNEKADELAKQGSGKEQEDNAVSYKEMKTIIKSLHRPNQIQDDYHKLDRQEQVIIFRLRTGHNRLNHHMYKCFKLVASPKCPCGEADQNAEHILQDCPRYQVLRQQVWPGPLTVHEKLYGSSDFLKRTS